MVQLLFLMMGKFFLLVPYFKYLQEALVEEEKQLLMF